MAKTGYGRRLSPQRTRGRGPAPSRTEPWIRSEHFDMTGGIRLDGSAREIPLNATPFMENIRFEDTGIRKDYGFRNLDAPAESRVIELIDHQFIANSQLYRRLVRMYRTTSGKLAFDVWNGVTWTPGTVSGTSIEDVLLSSVSYENKLIVADGKAQLQAWQEVPSASAREDDFPIGNALVAVGDTTTCVLSTGNAQGGQFDVHFSVSLTPLPGGIVDEHLFTNLASLHVRIEKLDGTVLSDRSYIAPNVTKTWSNEIVRITDLDLQASDSVILKAEAVGNHTDSFSVHGFEKAADGTAGVTYNEHAPPTNTFGLLNSDAPTARYLVAFRDRLIALQDAGDPQKVNWSVDGDSQDWTGDGSGTVFLVDVRSHPIDELMCAGAVASNVLALIRRRSIMRVRETGNVKLALGFEHWIEGLGTDARFSLQQTKDGIMFLGHDMIVYYFSGAVGPVPVGVAIQRALKDAITTPEAQENIDSAYDAIDGEYYLGIPENGSEFITRIWIFDLNRYLATKGQDIQWRTRNIKARRLSAVSALT